MTISLSNDQKGEIEAEIREVNRDLDVRPTIEHINDLLERCTDSDQVESFIYIDDHNLKSSDRSDFFWALANIICSHNVEEWSETYLGRPKAGQAARRMLFSWKSPVLKRHFAFYTKTSRSHDGDRPPIYWHFRVTGDDYKGHSNSGTETDSEPVGSILSILQTMHIRLSAVENVVCSKDRK
jgi:hypothetical protein